MPRPIVWTVAGSDSGGGAGIQADMLAIHALGGHPCTVVTALTAQNSVGVSRIECSSPEMVRATFHALLDDLPPLAVKTGMLGSAEVVRAVAEGLARLGGKVPVIVDPVMVSTTGASLLASHVGGEQDDDPVHMLKTHILPHAALVTPNIPEAARLCGCAESDLADPAAIEACAWKILAMGPHAVLVKGGHAKHADYASDCYVDAEGVTWLSLPRVDSTNSHGTGCTLSAAIATCVASGIARSNPHVPPGVAANISLLDAVVVAKAYVWNGLCRSEQYGKGPGPVAHTTWPREPKSIPWASRTPPMTGLNRCVPGPSEWSEVHVAPFPPCGDAPLAFYPIVPTAAMVETMARAGATTVQIRAKASGGMTEKDVEREVRAAVEVSRRYPSLRLFVNDHWRMAIACGAYGVHIGQEDLESADVDAIRAAGLRLGVSTHSYVEFARTKALRPSYVSLGPVFPTASKNVPFAPQGAETVRHWRELIPSETPLVAIGGITLANVREVIAAGASGVAVISAVTQAADLRAAAREWTRVVGEALPRAKLE